MRNRFINPADGSFYDWQVNHSEEEGNGQTRSIEHGALTGDGRLVMQQGDAGPLTLRFRGTILHAAQHAEFIRWWDRCETQTIFFRDFADEEYEVIVTAFNATRQRTIRNPRDFANAPYWFWRYEIDMEVVTVRSGPWVGV